MMRLRYLERVKELDLENLACRQELSEVLGLKNVSHEDLSRHHCMDKMVKGPRGTFLKNQDIGDSRLNWDSADVDNETSQIQVPQAIGESKTHSGTSQATKEYSQNQGSDSRTAESGGEAA